MQFKLAMLWSTVALAFSTAIASSIPAQAQSYQGLPVNLHRTKTARSSMTVRLKARPKKNLALKLTVLDMDAPDEGNLFINGKRVRALFGKAAVQQNNQKSAQVTVITPRNLWKAGSNKVEFVRTRNDGFNITKISTFESNTAPTIRPVTNTAQSQSAPAPTPTLAPRTAAVPTNQATTTTGSSLGAQLTKQAMVDMISRKHDVTPLPLLGNTGHCFRDQGRPTLLSNQQSSNCLSLNRKQNRFPGENTQNKKNVNTWTALSSGFTSRTSAAARNVGVEFGPTMLAVRRNGKWTTFKAKAPCGGYLHPKGAVDKRVGKSPMRCTNNGNSAIAGIGQGSWQNPAHHHHGFGGRQWSTTPGSIDRVIAYMPARLVKINKNKPADFNTASKLWTAAVGTDSRSDQDRASGKVSLRAMAHGQYKRLPSSGAWRPLVAHNLDIAEINSLMRNRPPSIPFNTNSF